MNARWIWATLAIVAMWVAALLISLFAPTLVVDAASGDHVDLPAAGIVAVTLAFVATVVLAVMGFRRERPAPTQERAEEARPVDQASPTGS
jgi:hypothetical protein